MRAPEGTTSRAENAGSIPVARSNRETQVRSQSPIRAVLAAMPETSYRACPVVQAAGHEPGSLVMERTMLLGIKQRAKQLDRDIM